MITWSKFTQHAMVVLTVVVALLVATCLVVTLWTVSSHNGTLGEIKKQEQTAVMRHDDTVVYLQAICDTTPKCVVVLHQLEKMAEAPKK